MCEGYLDTMCSRFHCVRGYFLSYLEVRINMSIFRGGFTWKFFNTILRKRVFFLTLKKKV